MRASDNCWYLKLPCYERICCAGGFTDVAYREGNLTPKMVPRAKKIPVTCACIPHPDLEGSGAEGALIPAFHPDTNATMVKQAGQASPTGPYSHCISLVAMAVGPNNPPAEPAPTGPSCSPHSSTQESPTAGPCSGQSIPCSPTLSPPASQGAEGQASAPFPSPHQRCSQGNLAAEHGSCRTCHNLVQRPSP